MIWNKRLYLISSAAVILIFLACGLFTLGDYGMGWDEHIRWRSGDLKLRYYQHLFQGDWENLQEHMIEDKYPGLFDLPLALFHKLFGGNRMIEGHVWSIAFGCLGLLSTCWLAYTVFGARTAFLSTLLLAVLPHFYGHAMMNPKDIPFMATYCLGLASILWITKQLLQGDVILWKSWVASGLAIGLASSSRVPGCVLLGLAAGSWAYAIYWKNGKVTTSLFASWGKGCLITGISALAVLLVFFPRMHFQFFSGISSVTTALHSSAGEIPLLFAGKAMNAIEAPAYYAHYFFLISTPIWMLFLLFAGLFISVRESIPDNRQFTRQQVLVGLFILLLSFPWVYILVTRPALHNGIRHLLFGIPPLIVLMGYTLHWCLRKLEGQSGKTRRIAVGVIALLMLNQVVSLVRMHPYQYVSFNLLAGDKPTVVNRYEGEYWFTSSKHLLEALDDLVRDMPLKPSASTPIKVRISGPLVSARSFVPEGFVLVNSFEEADFYLSNTTFRTDMLADGKVIYQITRQGIPIGVIKVLNTGQMDPGPGS